MPPRFNQRKNMTPSKIDCLTKKILIEYRWIFVCLFLLPISLLFDIWFYVRNWIVFKLKSAPNKHESKVKYVQKQVREWKKSGSQTKLCTARPGWQMMSFRFPRYKKNMYNINISNLLDILQIDTTKMTVRVEPLVNMSQLTATLLPLGWTLPIVPELDDLTVGGLVMGTGIESSSHIYGLFQHICVSFEVILADGSLITCSEVENSDVFYSVPWSYGTIGLLTAVELKIIPAKKFVELQYIPCKSLDEMISIFQQKSSQKNSDEFVEGIVYSKTEGVVMIGNLTDHYIAGKVNSIGCWYKPWFFLHVKSFLNESSNKKTEYIPLRDYYHRHTKSIFWELQDIIHFGNNILFRYLFGWLVPPKVSLLKLTQTQAIKELYENNHIIQDMLVPINKLKESLLLFDELVQVYPIWLCPFKLINNPGMVHPHTGKTEMFVDIGIYGVPKRTNFNPVTTTRKIEEFVVKNKGYQMLYADTYTTRDEFKKMFDHSLYDQIRRKLNCSSAFVEIYDKVNRKARL